MVSKPPFPDTVSLEQAVSLAIATEWWNYCVQPLCMLDTVLSYIWTVLQEIQCKVATQAMCISDLVVT